MSRCRRRTRTARSSPGSTTSPTRSTALKRSSSRQVRNVVVSTTTTTPRPTAAPAAADRFPLAALLVLALAGFVLLATETMPAGLLPQIAGGMQTTEAAAGQLVSAYALGTIIATLPAIAWTRSTRQAGPAPRPAGVPSHERRRRALEPRIRVLRCPVHLRRFLRTAVGD